MSPSKSLAGQIGAASAIVIVWSILDKVLAVAKEMLTAHRFGVSASLDVFNLTYSFPGIVVLLFAGTLAPAFVPLYLEWRNRSPAEADSNATWLMYTTALLFAVLSLGCYVFAPEIVRLVGYGFPPDEKGEAVIMERLLVFLIFVDGAGILFRGALHAKKLFFHLYVAPLFVNATIILLLLFDRDGDVYVLVWGFLVGTLLKTAYMAVALRREGFRYGIPLPVDRRKIQAFWLLAIPVLGSSLIANANLMIDQSMATQLPAGSLSTLRYAFRIYDLPIQVVIAALSIAIFPFISEEAAAGNQENLRRMFKYSLIFLGFVTIPLTCLMLLFSEDLVVLLLQRGAFDPEAARQTAQTLVCFSLGLFFYGYTFLNGTFFVALQRTKALLYMGVVSIFVNVLLNLLFMHWIGVQGIALSTSVTMFVISVVFMGVLKRRLGISDFSSLLASFVRMLLAAVGMWGAGWILLWVFSLIGADRWIFFPATATLVCAAYLGLLWVLRTEELHDCWESLGRLVPFLTAGRSAVYKKDVHGE